MNAERWLTIKESVQEPSHQLRADSAFPSGSDQEEAVIVHRDPCAISFRYPGAAGLARQRLDDRSRGARGASAVRKPPEAKSACRSHRSSGFLAHRKADIRIVGQRICTRRGSGWHSNDCFRRAARPGIATRSRHRPRSFGRPEADVRQAERWLQATTPSRALKETRVFCSSQQRIILRGRKP